MRIEYSQITKRKLANLKQDLTERFGAEFATKSIKKMTTTVRRLEQFPRSGVCIAEMYEIDTDYWFIFVNHNYFIYRMEADKLVIAQMFNEKEDVMLKLFGLSGRTQASIDFWGE